MVILAYTSVLAGSPADGTKRLRVAIVLGPIPAAQADPVQYSKVPLVLEALDCVKTLALLSER